ncbi:hypothetical protein BDN70DRAFT_901466 [Pholiota conissans]|uniref:Uncharacterized protein n=1 Tax=Pholiota conissans TaxID=109636 RepID=A0A9P5YMI4_9AGAR|nr:hypothetical protein BDN70DRAFT_901466 [Pholiota conissans]
MQSTPPLSDSPNIGINPIASQKALSAQALPLLASLRSVIVPLVQNVLPDICTVGIEEYPLGLEAQALLDALQNYISCIIRERIVRMQNIHSYRGLTPSHYQIRKHSKCNPRL